MSITKVELPSNKKFGFFFSFIFFLLSLFFYVKSSLVLSYSFIIFSIIFLAITIVKADILLPLNKLWMNFGILLGMIVNPIVMGLIFFGLFTPIAIFMRIKGRDELRIKVKEVKSYWILRKDEIQAESFKDQF